MKRTRLLLFTLLLDRLKFDSSQIESAKKLLDKSPEQIKALAVTATKRLRAPKQQVFLMTSRDPVCGSGAEEFHVTWAADIADAQERVIANCLQDGEVCTGGQDLVNLVDEIAELLSYAELTPRSDDALGKRRI